MSTRRSFIKGLLALTALPTAAVATAAPKKEPAIWTLVSDGQPASSGNVIRRPDGTKVDLVQLVLADRREDGLWDAVVHGIVPPKPVKFSTPTPGTDIFGRDGPVRLVTDQRNFNAEMARQYEVVPNKVVVTSTPKEPQPLIEAMLAKARARPEGWNIQPFPIRYATDWSYDVQYDVDHGVMRIDVAGINLTGCTRVVLTPHAFAYFYSGRIMIRGFHAFAMLNYATYARAVNQAKAEGHVEFWHAEIGEPQEVVPPAYVCYDESHDHVNNIDRDHGIRPINSVKPNDDHNFDIDLNI